MKTLPTLRSACWLSGLLACASLHAADFTGPNSANGSLVLTNQMVVTSAAAKAYDITVLNTSSSDIWLLCFDSATNKVNGATTSLSTQILAGKSGGFYWTEGRPFRRGITIAGSTTPGALTNTGTILWIDGTYLDRMY